MRQASPMRITPGIVFESEWPQWWLVLAGIQDSTTQALAGWSSAILMSCIRTPRSQLAQFSRELTVTVELDNAYRCYLMHNTANLDGY